MKAAGILALLVMLGTPPAVLAFECPKLQSRVDREYGKRFDRTATTVRSMAKQAVSLHKAGKEAESMKMCEEAAKVAGMKPSEMK